MKKFASATHSQTDLMLKMKPLSVKVVEATLKLSLSCVFLKEGKATWVLSVNLIHMEFLLTFHVVLHYLDLIIWECDYSKSYFVTAPKLDFSYRYLECILNLKREVAACPVRGIAVQHWGGFLPWHVQVKKRSRIFQNNTVNSQITAWASEVMPFELWASLKRCYIRIK